MVKERTPEENEQQKRSLESGGTVWNKCRDFNLDKYVRRRGLRVIKPRKTDEIRKIPNIKLRYTPNEVTYEEETYRKATQVDYYITPDSEETENSD